MAVSRPSGQALDHYLRTNFEIIQTVFDNIEAISAVANHLTPVEDLLEFQAEIGALHTKLGLLVDASELLMQASDAGFAILSAPNTEAQRALLGMGTAAQRHEDHFATAVDMLGLSEQVTTLVNELAIIVSGLSALATKAELNQLDLKLAQLLQDVAALQTGFAGINGQISTNAYAIAGLSNSINTHSSLIEAVSQYQVELGTDVASTKTGLAAQGAALLSLTNRTVSNEDSINSHSNSLLTLATGVANLNTGAIATGQAIDAIDLKATSTQNTQSIQGNTLTQLAGQVADTESGLSALGEVSNELILEIQQTQDSLTVVGEEVSTLKSAITSVGNLLANTSFENGFDNWEIFSKGSGWATAELVNNLEPNRTPPGMKAMSVQGVGTPTGSLGIRSGRIPIEALKSYFLSAYLAAENCTVRVEWRAHTSTGSTLPGVVGSTTLGPNTNLGSLVRVIQKMTASHDVNELEMQVWVADCTGIPKIWVVRPQIEHAIPGQLTASPWIEGVAGLVDAFSEANKALSTRVELTEAGLLATASDVTNLTVSVASKASSSALDSVVVRVTEAEGKITSDAVRLASIEVRVPAGTDKLANEARVVAAESASVDRDNASSAAITQVRSSLDSRPNLSVNPTLKANSVGWAFWGSASRGIGGWGTGVVIPATEDSQAFFIAPVSGPGTYTVSADIANSSTAGGVVIAAIAVDSAGGPTGVWVEGGAPTGDWARRAVTVTGGAGTAAVRFIHRAISTNAPTYSRRFKLEEGGAATLYNESFESQLEASITQSLIASAGPGGSYAQATVMTDVNGRLAGTRLTNNGVETAFDILSDRFSVSNASGQGLTWENGVMVMRANGYMTATGGPFGVNNEFIRWFGPDVSLASCGRNNAYSFETKDGLPYFGGVLTKSAIITTGSSSIYGNTTAQATPFTTAGKVRKITVTCSRSSVNGWIAGNNNGGVGNPFTVTITLQRKLGAGAWTTINTKSETAYVAGIVAYEPEMNVTRVSVSASVGLQYDDTNTTTGTVQYQAIVAITAGTLPTVSLSQSGTPANQPPTQSTVIRTSEEGAF
ncbi:MAG: hypothetical protein ACOH2T_19235 [Pseudomonas sp.]